MCLLLHPNLGAGVAMVCFRFRSCDSPLGIVRVDFRGGVNLCSIDYVFPQFFNVFSLCTFVGHL